MHVLAEKEEVDMENVKMDFQLIFDQNPIPMWVHDRRTFTFLDVNQKFEKAFGYARDEILQMTLEDFFSAHQVPPLLLNLNQTPQPMPMLHLWGIRHKGGHVVNVEIACQPVAYQGGDAALVTAFLRNDQSLEKRTLEARLRISEFALSHSLDDILQKTLDEAELLTGSNIGFFHFMEADQKTLWLQNWSSNTLRNMCTAEGKYSHYPVEQAGIWADCARQRRPVMYNDYQSMGRAGTLPKGHAGLSRILTVPVMRGDAIVAIVGVGNKPASYDERDLMGVNLLADLAWDIAETKKAEDDLRKSEANYRTVMDQASDCIYIADLQGNYLDVNRAGCELLGYEREELLCLNIRDVIMAEPAQPLRLPELIIGKSVLSERRMKRKDGSFVLVEISAKRIDEKRLLGIVRDITERKQEEEKLRYHALVMSNVSSAVISTDLEMHITQWNKGAERLYGWSESEALGWLIDDVCQTEFRTGQQEDAQQHLFAEKKWQGELKQYHRNGSEIWVDAYVTMLEGENGNYTGAVTINHDITERKRVLEELHQANDEIERFNRNLRQAFEREQIASRTDALTGVYNRRYFFELIEYEFSASQRYGRPLSLIMFDVDHFKQINDSYGHQVGDEVLKGITKIVREQLRESDVLSRYGGDEFTVLLPNSTTWEAEEVLKRIHMHVRSLEFEVHAEKVHVTISAGVANLHPEMKAPSQLVHLADIALYAAKQTGRNRTKVSDAMKSGR